MDLSVHKAITAIALLRAAKRLKTDLSPHFNGLWVGNWLTDLNQVTAFLDMVEKRVDPYAVFDESQGTYIPPAFVNKRPKEWTNLYNALWDVEWEDTYAAYKGFFNLSEVPTTRNLQVSEIEGYYPKDHFDVVDRIVNGQLIDMEAPELNAYPDQKMTRTAYDGVYGYCYTHKLVRPFSCGTRDRTARENLLLLGHASHSLQDFFAHSNFIELMLMLAAHQDMLDPDLCEVLKKERNGTFDSYYVPLTDEGTPVMTGRFDRLDTLASLLKIYQNGLVPHWEDLGAGGFINLKKLTKNEMIFEVMFGTFSGNPFTQNMIGTVFAMNKFREGLTGIVKKVKLGVLSLGTTVAKYFSGPGTRGLWDDLDDVIGTMSQDKVKNFEKAGRARYYEYIIETLLRDKLDQATSICLPHHTLIAKDNDITQPECRLAYKLACVMATEVTTELFVRYFSGQNAGDPAVARDLLSAYYIHPSMHLTGGLPRRLKMATRRLGGSRWWQYASDNTRPLVRVG